MEKLKDILGIIYIILAFIFLIYCWIKIAKSNKRVKKESEEFEKIINEEKAQLEVMKAFNKSLEDNKDEV